MKNEDIEKSLERIFIYGFNKVKSTIDSNFQENLENYFRNDIKYIIDNTNYQTSSNYVKLTLLDEHFNPVLVINLDRYLEVDEFIFKLIVNYEVKYKITELYRHKHYEVKEA